MPDAIVSSAESRFGDLLVNLDAMPDEAWATLASDVREDRAEELRRLALVNGTEVVEYDGALLPVEDVRRWKFDAKSTERVVRYVRPDGGWYERREPQ